MSRGLAAELAGVLEAVDEPLVGPGDGGGRGFEVCFECFDYGLEFLIGEADSVVFLLISVWYHMLGSSFLVPE